MAFEERKKYRIAIKFQLHAYESGKREIMKFKEKGDRLEDFVGPKIFLRHEKAINFLTPCVINHIISYPGQV